MCSVFVSEHEHMFLSVAPSGTYVCTSRMTYVAVHVYIRMYIC